MTEIPDFRTQYPALFAAIRKVVPASMKLYLVGGAVRDLLLGKKIRDFDFTVEGLVRPIGKGIANELQGAYYVLDDEREMVRVIVSDEQAGSIDIDIARLSGKNIQEDLSERDFTINAIAVEIGSELTLTDPLNGVFDLKTHTLRMCSAYSLQNDPIRALRAVRMALEFNLTMDSILMEEMKAISAILHRSSFERYRDETFKILKLGKDTQAIQLFRQYGFLDFLIPGWNPDALDAHKRVILNTNKILSFLSAAPSGIEAANDGYFDVLEQHIRKNRGALCSYIRHSVTAAHNAAMLTSLAAVFQAGAGEKKALIKTWAARFVLSGNESEWVEQSLQAVEFLRSRIFAKEWKNSDSYHYFKNFRTGGISGVLLYLAEFLPDKQYHGKFSEWVERVQFADALLDAYFNAYDSIIAPKPLLNGNAIAEISGKKFGPVIGDLKNRLIDAQIDGIITNADDAKILIRELAGMLSESPTE